MTSTPDRYAGASGTRRPSPWSVRTRKSGDSRCVRAVRVASLRVSASLRFRDTGITRVTNDSCPRAGSNHRALSLPERLLDAALEAIEHRLPMTLRVQLETVRSQTDLLGRSPQRGSSSQMPPVRGAAQPLRDRGGRREQRLDRGLHALDYGGPAAGERPGTAVVKVRVKAVYEAILREQRLVHLATDDRFEMDDLTGREQILLVEREARVGDGVVRADGAPARKEESITMLDDRVQRRAAFVLGENPRRRERHLERLPELRQRQGILEDGRVEHAACNGDLLRSKNRCARHEAALTPSCCV